MTKQGKIIIPLLVIIVLGAAVYAGYRWGKGPKPEPIEDRDPILDSLAARNRELADSVKVLAERSKHASAVRKIYLDRYDTIYIHTDTLVLLNSLRTIASIQPKPR